MVDKIPKLLTPIYDAENNLTDFDTELEIKYGIDYELEDCKRCGSKAFYIRKATATKNTKELDEEDVTEEVLIDMELACAECGCSQGGYTQNENFRKMTEKRSIEQMKKANEALKATEEKAKGTLHSDDKMAELIAAEKERKKKR